MRAGPQLRVDAYGVSGFTRLCRSASSPSQHSFCTLLRRISLGRRLHSHDEQSLSSNYATNNLALYMHEYVYKTILFIFIVLRIITNKKSGSKAA